ncbi:MAG TPA: hypothetical protein VMQ62_07110 [Dongiaceae bacterium]|nr:hypothetical protein [Dongiaceae bacterium]
MAAPASSRWPRPTVDEVFCLVAGLTLTLLYAWLLDDAYIYFKYVDNWLFLGRGLVYNPGEYAEGYTSPLWILLLAALRRLGFGYWTIVRGTGLAAFAAFWCGCVLVHRRLLAGVPGRGDDSSPGTAAGRIPRVNLPLSLLALNYGLLSYFTSGTESPLVALAAVACALCLIGPTGAIAQVAVGLSPLVRPELGLVWFLTAGWLTWRDRRPPWLLLSSGVVANGGWLLFRALYYADLFPTTFYLKVRSDPMQGLLYLHDAFAPYYFYAFALLGLIMLGSAWVVRWELRATTHARTATAAIACVMLAYVVLIGGDARHFRYLVFPVCLGALAVGGLPEGWWSARRRIPKAGIGILLSLSIAFLSASGTPRQARRNPLGRLLAGDDSPAVEPQIVDGIADAEHHRQHPELPRLSPWGTGAAIELRGQYEAWRSVGGADPPQLVNAEYLCWFHYRHFDQWSVHGFGLTDVVLARSRGEARGDDRPGHRMALLDRARELAALLPLRGLPPRAGTYRAAIEAGVAPPWVRANLPVLELLERKVYGPRDAWESLRLATHVGERVELDAAPAATPPAR